MMNQINIEALRRSLAKGHVAITAMKKDGTVVTRVMTTKLPYMPSADQPKGIRDSSPSVVPAWDVERQGWRSFRVENIMSWEIA